MPTIVILDSDPLFSSKEELARLSKLGVVRLYSNSRSEDVVERCRDAEIVLTTKVVLNRSLLEQLPRLQYIGVTTTGVDVVDLEAARARKIVVTHVPSYGAASVAQHAAALLLAATNHVSAYHTAVRQREWSRSHSFCLLQQPLLELEGLTLGLLGAGQIGTAFAQIGRAFGMKVTALKRSGSQRTVAGVEYVDWTPFWSESDVISLHAPLYRETKNIVNVETLALMKPTAILVNTSRGGLVDQDALAAALKHGQILCAVLDVLAEEPPRPDCPLLDLENCIITPHIAWAGEKSHRRLVNQVIENLQAFLAGAPIRVVS
jgi:glycerate dehydrogenase